MDLGPVTFGAEGNMAVQDPKREGHLAVTFASSLISRLSPVGSAVLPCFLSLLPKLQLGQL